MDICGWVGGRVGGGDCSLAASQADIGVRGDSGVR